MAEAITTAGIAALLVTIAFVAWKDRHLGRGG
jgi:hypothetical protein